jgi:KRAB domain-containing zinc finger protein
MIHTGDLPFTCICGKGKDFSAFFVNTYFLLLLNIGFRLNSLLQLHMKNKHILGGREYKCSVPSCSWEFTTASKLKAHLETHSQKKIPCSICNKIFCSETALNVHLVQHSDSNPWKCSKCEKKFSCHSSMKNHFDNLHSQNFKFRCDICQFGASNKSSLERHMVSHKEEKDFRCILCGNYFKVPYM